MQYSRLQYTAAEDDTVQYSPVEHNTVVTIYHNSWRYRRKISAFIAVFKEAIEEVRLVHAVQEFVFRLT